MRRPIQALLIAASLLSSQAMAGPDWNGMPTVG